MKKEYEVETIFTVLAAIVLYSALTAVLFVWIISL